MSRDEKLNHIAVQLLMQEDHITSDPVYCVKQKHRIYGVEDSDTYIWIDNRCGEQVYDGDDGMVTRLEEASRSGADTVLDDDEAEVEMSCFEKRYYQEISEFVQACFTQEGAEAYIRADGHNLHQPFVYVESGYRNAEWIWLRKLLMKAGNLSEGDIRTLNAFEDEKTFKETPLQMYAAMFGERIVNEILKETPDLTKVKTIQLQRLWALATYVDTSIHADSPMDEKFPDWERMRLEVVRRGKADILKDDEVYPSWAATARMEYDNEGRRESL